MKNNVDKSKKLILGIETSCDETPYQIGRCAFRLIGEAGKYSARLVTGQAGLNSNLCLY